MQGIENEIVMKAGTLVRKVLPPAAKTPAGKPRSYEELLERVLLEDLEADAPPLR